MKKGKKAAIIVAAALIVIGLLICFLGFSAMEYDYTGLNTANFVTNSNVITESFSHIEVDVETADVHFVRADDSSCKIVSKETDKITCSAAVENDTLVIRELDRRQWYDHIGIFWGEIEITVYLPKTEYETLSIISNTGDIEAAKDFSFGNAEIVTNTGDVSFSAAVKNQLEITSDTGDIIAQGLSPQTLRLKTDTGSIAASSLKIHEDVQIVTDTGNITVSSLEIHEDIQIGTDTGKVEISDAECANFFAESDTGDIMMENVIVSGEVRMESRTGDIRLLACDADTLSIETDTGDVSGTLLTEKVYITQTDTGDIDVPKTIKGGRCEVTTDTGDITFQGK